MKEIERKFLVKKEIWEKLTKAKPIQIKQAYLSKNDKGVVRIRIKGERAFLTIKSANHGVERHEFEYEVPEEEAKLMFDLFCDKYIEKLRFEVPFEGKIWEVDEFIMPQQNFILAEIELEHSDEKFVLPEWVEKEVSDEPIYFNSNML